MTKDDKKRKELITQAEEMDAEIYFLESELWDIVRAIQDLKPTKKELKNGVQELIDAYGR